MALVRWLRSQERDSAVRPPARSTGGFRTLVDRLRSGERDAFEEVFDAFFLYVHYHVELAGRIDGVPLPMRQQVTSTALRWLFQELMQARDEDGAAPLDGATTRPQPAVDPALRPPWNTDERLAQLHPSWTRRALELAARAQHQILAREAAAQPGRRR